MRRRCYTISLGREGKKRDGYHEDADDTKGLYQGNDCVEKTDGEGHMRQSFVVARMIDDCILKRVGLEEG